MRDKTVSIYVDPLEDYLITLVYRHKRTKCVLDKDLYTYRMPVEVKELWKDE